MHHVVALSGGKDSTAMALELREREPGIRFTYICTPTGNELPAMIDHWLKLEELLDTRLTYLTSGHSLGSLIDKWDALPNWRQRCSSGNGSLSPAAPLSSNSPWRAGATRHRIGHNEKACSPLCSNGRIARDGATLSYPVHRAARDRR